MTDEQTIIERTRSGDINAFEVLVEIHKAHVFRIVGRYLTEQDDIADVAQTVFIRAFQSLPGYRGEAPFEHWLSRIAVRSCYDFWRKERRKMEVPLNAEHLALIDSNASLDLFREEAAIGRAAEVLQWAMSKLTAEDRMALSLLYMDGYPEKEAAEILGWSLPKIKSRAFRARKVLEREVKKLLEKVSI